MGFKSSRSCCGAATLFVDAHQAIRHRFTITTCSNNSSVMCRRGSIEQGVRLVSGIMLVRIQSSALFDLNESALRVWRMHDCLRSSRTRFDSSVGYSLMRDHECFVIERRSRVERGRGTSFCPWSVVDARDSAKVVDQVQLLAGTLTE